MPASFIERNAIKSFAEVFEQRGGAAGGGVGVSHHTVELLHRVLLLPLVLHLMDPVLDPPAVAAAVIKDTSRRQPVPPGPAGLLVITLQVARQVSVYHEPHVRLVDAHPECDRRHHHPGVAIDKVVLILRAVRVLHPRVIRHGRNPCGPQTGGEFIAFFPTSAIDDALVSRVLLQHCKHLFIYFLLRPNYIMKVLALEPAAVDGGVAERELADHVPLHPGRGGGGERHDRRVDETAAERPLRVAESAEHPVLGAEVVAPLADAVRLIDGEAGDVKLLQQPLPRRGKQPLGGKVKQVVLPRLRRPFTAEHLVVFDGGIE